LIHLPGQRPDHREESLGEGLLEENLVDLARDDQLGFELLDGYLRASKSYSWTRRMSALAIMRVPKAWRRSWKRSLRRLACLRRRHSGGEGRPSRYRLGRACAGSGARQAAGTSLRPALCKSTRKHVSVHPEAPVGLNIAYLLGFLKSRRPDLNRGPLHYE
jgi:hypothetical protein